MEHYLCTLIRLIRDHTEELAHSITVEQGKTLADARGDVFRGLEVVETACNVASTSMGETQENLARGVDTYTYRQPLGVTAGIWFVLVAMQMLTIMSVVMQPVQLPRDDSSVDRFHAD